MRPRSLLAALLLLGTACGGAGTPSTPPQAAPAQQTAPAPATSPSAAPLQPTSAPAGAPAATSAPQAQTSPAAPPAPAAAAPSYKGVPVGRLPEGFYTLGAPEAPVTLTDYSDFL